MTVQMLASPALAGDAAVVRAETRIGDALELAEAPVVTCSMQLGGLVLLDLLRRSQRRVPVVFVDTGYHFAETIAFRDAVAALWDLDLRVAAPAQTRTDHEIVHGRLHLTDPLSCCAMRKVGPADAAIEGHDLWFSAVRRSQGSGRVDLPASTEHRRASGGLIRKIHPLVDWTWADVERYAHVNAVPRHPLYDRGYTSIGCAPCTQPTHGEGDDRGGRWTGTEKTECGLHDATRRRP